MSRGAKISFQRYSESIISRLLIIALILPVSILCEYHRVRPIQWAGIAYPGNSTELYSQLNAFLESSPDVIISDDVCAVLMPDAPYIYSGHILAKGYKAISQVDFDNIIIIGAEKNYQKPAIYSGARYSSPMGRLPYDEALGNKITSLAPDLFQKISVDVPLPRSIEIQLPFIQHLFGQIPVVAIGVNNISASEAFRIADIIEIATRNSKTMIIGVSNLSEYHDCYTCMTLDNVLIDRINDMAFEQMTTEFVQGKIQAESPGVILSLLKASSLKQADSCQVLSYTNSGNITGDFDQVSGYSVVLFGKRESNYSDNANLFDKGYINYIVRLAQWSIQRELGLGSSKPQYSKSVLPGMTDVGVYLSLYQDGRLRGSAGSLFNKFAPHEVITIVSLAAAFSDPRFKPVSLDDLDFLEYKLYLLTDIRELDNPLNFNSTDDGLMINKRTYSAIVFPDEIDKELEPEAVLGRLCIKAGLLSGCWKEADSKLWKFKVNEFAEK